MVLTFFPGYPEDACSIKASLYSTHEVQRVGEEVAQGPRAALLFARLVSKGCSAHGTSPAMQH